MTVSSGLGLPFITDGVGGAVLYNEALAVLEIVYGKGVEDFVDNAASLSPSEQEAWIVRTPGTSDEFYTHEGEIAVWLNSQWKFYAASQGVRTWNRAENKALVRGSSAWHYATGVAVWFGRLSTAHAYSGTAADSINGWTQMVETPSSDALFDHNPTASDDGRMDLVEAGIYRCCFSGVVVPAVAADTYRIGFGVNSTTPASGGFADFAFVAGDLGAPRAFSVDMVRSFSAGDDLYVTCDKQTAGAGTLTFVDESCKWTVEKLSP